MTWFTWAEKRRKLLIGGISLIGILALLVCARRNTVSFDSFWHLKMGTDWIVNGLSPWVDHYSFTFRGEAISSPPVIFQAILHWFVAQFGQVTGNELLKLVCYVLTLGTVLFYLRRLKAQVFIYLIVIPMVVSLIELRAIVRPELISYTLAVLALVLYHRARAVLSASTVIPIVLLMWFWSNYHNPIIGYVIYFGFFIDVGIRQFNERASSVVWTRWLAWGLLVIAVGLIRPDFSHPVYNALTFDSAWKSLIQEYTSPILYKGVASVYALVTITLIALIFAIRQRRFGYVAVILVLVYGASTMARLVTPGGIVITCIFAHVVSQVDWRSRLERSGVAYRSVTAVIVLALVVLPLHSTVTLARDYMAENRRSEAIFPHDVVRHMKALDRAGRVFNEYQIGGYLIYRLSPDSTVYIDGRTNILYPVHHYKRLRDAQRSPEVLREEVEKYGITLVMLQDKSFNYFLMDEVGEFGLDFVGADYSLFAKENPLFPTFGHLLARPACWSEEMEARLMAEEANALVHLPRSSALWPLLGVVMNYAQTDVQSAAIEEFANAGVLDDDALRFAAFRALDHDLEESTLRMLTSVESKQLKDHLAAALAMIRMGKFDNAERTLKIASETVWPYLELPDIVIMKGLLRQLQQERPLTMVTRSFVEYLDRHMQEAGLSGKEYAVTSELFCANEGWQDQL